MYVVVFSKNVVADGKFFIRATSAFNKHRRPMKSVGYFDQRR